MQKKHLGNALQRARAQLQSKEGGEVKFALPRARNVEDLIEQIEQRGLPTDLSPRLRKPMSLAMEAFEHRPKVTFGPVARRGRTRVVR